MRLHRRCLRAIRALFRKPRLDAEMDEEMRAHVEMRTKQHIAAGMNPAEARYAARRQFGWVESIQETCREQRGTAWLEGAARDLRFAFRQLRKNPGFTIVASLTIALCLGANLTIFAVLDSVLLRPLPFPGAAQLVTLYNTYPRAGVERDGASLPNYYERRGQIAAFSQFSILRYDTAIVGEPGSSRREDVLRVSPEFFTTLGVRLAQGREFTDDETTYQTDAEAILTDGYWRQNFNADPNIIGRHVRVDGLSKTVVGVLPPSFHFLSSEARLFFPLSSNPGDREASQRHSGNGYEMIGRLRPGVHLAQAQAEIDAHNAAHAAEYPQAKMIADAGFRTVVTPLHADHVQAVRPVLWLLQAGVLLLALIGAVNLVNLLLIRASGRARELAIRQSLGASARRVVRQVMTENLVLALVGGAVGLGVGAAGIRLVMALGVARLPMGAHIAFDGRLALVGLLCAVAFGLASSLPIAWLSLRGQPSDALQSESRGGTASPAAQRLRHGFIVAQIAMAFVLLAGAGSLGLSLKRALAVSPGFRPDHVMTGQISLPWKDYPDWPARLAFLDRLLERLRRQPGVSAVGVINNVPFSGNNGKMAITVKGHVVRPGESLQAHYGYGVAGDAFTALGIPLREGRFIGNDDPDRCVCDVDEDFARRYWPKGDALGHRLFFGGTEGSDAEAFTVVGVVGAVKQTEITDSAAQGAVYFPYQYRTVPNVFAVVRTSRRPELLGATLQKIVRELNPELPVNDLRSMDVRLTESLVARRSPALLAGVFAGAALLLAAIGTYGVLAYAVTQRRREIGVRLALGALPRQISRRFLGLGLRLLALGAMVGVFGAWLAVRAMQRLLFAAPPFPTGPIAGAALVLTVVSLIACLAPTLRASRVDPTEALRHE